MTCHLFICKIIFRRDFESETDAGDFERLSRQSTSQKQRVDISTLCVPDTMAVSTVTEVRPLPVIPEADESPKRCEFENSEFYIEESLPSSLEWGRDERQVNPNPVEIITLVRSLCLYTYSRFYRRLGAIAYTDSSFLSGSRLASHWP